MPNKKKHHHYLKSNYIITIRMPKNENATIYLLEDINDNRYVGSTGELKLYKRLSTHRRDEKEYLFGIRKNPCSSMKLDLYHSNITPLMTCKNNSVERKKWERHFINNVYPECVNEKRLNFNPEEWGKQYYQKNKEKKIKQADEWRKNNKDKVNAGRRKYYQKNKEKILKRRKELQEMKRLENL